MVCFPDTISVKCSVSLTTIKTKIASLIFTVDSDEFQNIISERCRAEETPRKVDEIAAGRTEVSRSTAGPARLRCTARCFGLRAPRTLDHFLRIQNALCCVVLRHTHVNVRLFHFRHFEDFEKRIPRAEMEKLEVRLEPTSEDNKPAQKPISADPLSELFSHSLNKDGGTGPFRIIRTALFANEKVELCESRIMTPVNTHTSPNLF